MSVGAELAEDQLGFFRWGHLADQFVITNDAGDWLVLSQPELTDLLAGRIAQGHPRFVDLQRKGFLRDGLDLDALASRIAKRSRHVTRGPHLHGVVLVAPGADGESVLMPPAIAEKVVDFALQSMAPSMTFELRAHDGEPLRNFETLRFIVETCRSRNQRGAGKSLSFRVFTNFAALNEESAEWLIANDLTICTSLDGPAAVHDANRQWKAGSAHADVVRWIDYFHRRYAELGRDVRVEALATVTRRSLAVGREMIDEYVRHGLQSIQLQPLTASAVPPDAWQQIGYPLIEFMEFYRGCLDYILDLNSRGVVMLERTAATVVKKMLSGDDPGIADIQSPCGDGTAQIVYDADGRVFPSDAARLIDVAGDPLLELGNVQSLTLPELLRHPTVRAIAAASILDAQPMCTDCWNKPFCGYSPSRNYREQGDLVGQRPHCTQCRTQLAVSTRLVELLSDEAHAARAEALKRWATTSSELTRDAVAWAAAP